MLAWSRRRPGVAGLLLGLGAAAKLYPLFLLFPLLLLCLRAGRMRAWWTVALTGLVTWAVVNLPVAVLRPDRVVGVLPPQLHAGAPIPTRSTTSSTGLTGWAGFDGPLASGRAARRCSTR